jgi:glycosyltransferase involved in cell wall biosynthesis
MRLTGSAPVVSIVTPTFNHERFIRRCLDSAIAQTDPRWEQIVVDDGSDDGTESIVRSIDDPRIRYIRMNHRGIMHLAETYNVALNLSRGAFVAVLEGDDFWPADKIERQVPLFDRPEIVLTWGIAGIANEVGDILGTFANAAAVRMRGQTPGENIRALLKRNFIPAGTVMCRREALMRIGGFRQPDGIPTTDYPTWLELCRVGWFSPANEVLGFHTSHQGQTSRRMRAEMDYALSWGARFVEGLPDRERESLGLSVEEAHQIERNNRGYLLYDAGRAALADDKRPTAQALFRQALRDGAGMTRLKAGIGLTCAYLRIDFEGLATLAGRRRAR